MDLLELQHFLDINDNRNFTECKDRRYWAYDGMGLSKLGKVALTNVSLFKNGDNLKKWMGSVWTCILLHQSDVALLHWVYEANYLDMQRPTAAAQYSAHCCAQVQHS